LRISKRTKKALSTRIRDAAVQVAALLGMLSGACLLPFLFCRPAPPPMPALYVHVGIGLLALLFFLVAGMAQAGSWVAIGITWLQRSTLS
jgi:hypothetical protein